MKRMRVRRALEKLYETERPLAVVEPSTRDADVLLLGGVALLQGRRPEARHAARRLGDRSGTAWRACSTARSRSSSSST